MKNIEKGTLLQVRSEVKDMLSCYELYNNIPLITREKSKINDVVLLLEIKTAPEVFLIELDSWLSGPPSALVDKEQLSTMEMINYFQIDILSGEKALCVLISHEEYVWLSDPSKLAAATPYDILSPWFNIIE